MGNDSPRFRSILLRSLLAIPGDKSELVWVGTTQLARINEIMRSRLFGVMLVRKNYEFGYSAD